MRRIFPSPASPLGAGANVLTYQATSIDYCHYYKAPPHQGRQTEYVHDRISGQTQAFNRARILNQLNNPSAITLSHTRFWRICLCLIQERSNCRIGGNTNRAPTLFTGSGGCGSCVDDCTACPTERCWRAIDRCYRLCWMCEGRTTNIENGR